MNFAETLISKKIKEAEPTIDIFKADHQLLNLACQDLSNYFKFNMNFAEETTSGFNLAQKTEQLYKEDPNELDCFLSIWTNLWLKKWKQRIRLLIGTRQLNETCEPSKVIPDTETQYRKLACKKEMLEIITSALIRNAEICGTKILAEYILKKQLNQKTLQNINTRKQDLAILGNALRKVREMSRINGPLIHVKVDQSYFCPYSN